MLSLQEQFYRGNYSQILEFTVDSHSGTFDPPMMPYVVGALMFQGRLDEAETIFKVASKSKLSEEDLVISRFFLAVGMTRYAHYDKGIKLFTLNLRQAGRNANPRVRFYIYQGLGFYRHAGSRFKDSARYASQAFAAALEANFLYGKVLSADLLAHSLVGPGQVQSASEYFRRAIKYSTLLGHGGILQALEVSSAIHSAQHGLNPGDDIANLEVLMQRLTDEDSYSRARLLLEIARQKILRGQITAAKTALDQSCRLVYGSQNRRYSIILNLRYAHILHLSGEQHQALNLLRNAKKELDPKVDLYLSTKVHGLELKITESIQTSAQEAKLLPNSQHSNKHIKQLIRRSGNLISQRIQHRSQYRSYNNLNLIGDDPLGDIADLSFSRSVLDTKKIIDSGYLYFLINKLGLEAGTRSIQVEPLPGFLLIFSLGDLHLIQNGFSPVMRELLRCFASGFTDKASLIAKVWKYKYNPIRHDQLVYSSVSRLRQILGPYADWIDVSEDGYCMKNGISVHFHNEIKPTEMPASIPIMPSPSLNYRQVGVMDYLNQHDFIDAKTCGVLYKISDVSARRDLSLLVAHGLLQRQGQGKATRYLRVKSDLESSNSGL